MSTFPKSVQLGDGATIDIRTMSRSDRDSMLAFARDLPEQDLLFLRTDISEPRAVDEWIENLESGDSCSLVAYAGDDLVGYATVHRARARWTRRVGEIRVNVAPAYRSRGLGRILTGEIFDVARGLGLKKLMANMTTDQRGAQAAFRRLGFVAEGLLTDFVEDRDGGVRDMVIMCYDIDGHSEHVEDRVRI